MGNGYNHNHQMDCRVNLEIDKWVLRVFSQVRECLGKKDTEVLEVIGGIEHRGHGFRRVFEVEQLLRLRFQQLPRTIAIFISNT